MYFINWFRSKYLWSPYSPFWVQVLSLIFLKKIILLYILLRIIDFNNNLITCKIVHWCPKQKYKGEHNCSNFKKKMNIRKQTDFKVFRKPKKISKKVLSASIIIILIIITIFLYNFTFSCTQMFTIEYPEFVSIPYFLLHSNEAIYFHAINIPRKILLCLRCSL